MPHVEPITGFHLDSTLPPHTPKPTGLIRTHGAPIFVWKTPEDRRKYKQEQGNARNRKFRAALKVCNCLPIFYPFRNPSVSSLFEFHC